MNFKSKILLDDRYEYDEIKDKISEKTKVYLGKNIRTYIFPTKISNRR